MCDVVDRMQQALRSCKLRVIACEGVSDTASVSTNVSLSVSLRVNLSACLSAFERMRV